MENKSIYERLGGEAAVGLATEKFYDKLLADPELKKYFGNSNHKNMVKNIKDFITLATGGPNKYTGRSMKDIHSDKSFITDWHFNQVKTHLADTLIELGVSKSLVKEVADLVETLRKDIVQKTLYERLGGDAAVTLATEKFYDKLLADPELKKYFAKSNHKNVVKNIKDFVTLATGGPNKYTGKNMKDLHSDKPYISDWHFDIVKKHLEDTLIELGVNSSLVKEMADLVETLRKDIVQKCLYERLGGEAAVGLATEKFYDKLLADPQLKKYFGNSNHTNVVKNIKDFMTLATGGPNKYTGKNMKDLHSDKPFITDWHFDQVKKHLEDTLVELSVSTYLVKDVAALIEGLRNDIVQNITVEKKDENARQACCSNCSIF